MLSDKGTDEEDGVKTPQGSDEIDPNPTSSDASSKETDELLPDETLSSAQGASAWAIMFGSLLAVSCAFALPFASFAAGVGFWVSQYSKLIWVLLCAARFELSVGDLELARRFAAPSGGPSSVFPRPQV